MKRGGPEVVAGGGSTAAGGGSMAAGGGSMAAGGGSMVSGGEVVIAGGGGLVPGRGPWGRRLRDGERHHGKFLLFLLGNCLLKFSELPSFGSKMKAGSAWMSGTHSHMLRQRRMEHFEHASKVTVVLGAAGVSAFVGGERGSSAGVRIVASGLRLAVAARAGVRARGRSITAFSTPILEFLWAKM
jgi:hypothetical protein